MRRFLSSGGTKDDLNPLVKAFTPEVTKSLQDFLRNGGRYLGICGGGFMASTGWEEVDQDMTALGIIPASSAMYIPEFTPRIITVQWLGKNIPDVFSGRPKFPPVEKRGELPGSSKIR